MSLRRALFCLSVLALAACSDEERPPGQGLFPPEEDAGARPDAPWIDGGFQDGPPPQDASGYCGNQFFDVTPEPPNLYFVIDRSGSMLGFAYPGSDQTKLTAVRIAAMDVIVDLGHRVNVGAAVFPGNPFVNECSVGKEVLSTRPGDMPGTFEGEAGPVAQAFSAATNLPAKGGTPIAATLTLLAPTLRALEGKTAVVLMTDGGPNCSLAHQCGPEDCIWNIEGGQLAGEWCTPSYNCCDPAIPYGPGALSCLDGSATVAAVADLRDAGIRTYVVGIPGSEYYVALLDQLATVGGSARPGATRYYRVDDVTNLGSTLAAIGKRALITCEFSLDQPPPDPDFVNVYLDSTLVPYDEEDGWSWTGDTSLALNGEACDRLESGEVATVQVVAGCPTQQPR